MTRHGGEIRKSKKRIQSEIRSGVGPGTPLRGGAFPLPRWSDPGVRLCLRLGSSLATLSPVPEGLESAEDTLVVAEDGTVTLPSQALETLGVEDDGVLTVWVERGRMFLEKHDPAREHGYLARVEAERNAAREIEDKLRRAELEEIDKKLEEEHRKFQAATATEGSTRDALVAKLEYLPPVSLAAAKESMGSPDPAHLATVDEVVDQVEGVSGRNDYDFDALVTSIRFAASSKVPHLYGSYDWDQGKLSDVWGTTSFSIVRVEEGGFLWAEGPRETVGEESMPPQFRGRLPWL